MPQEEKKLSPGKLWPNEGEEPGAGNKTKNGQLLGSVSLDSPESLSGPYRPGSSLVVCGNSQEKGRSPGRVEPLRVGGWRRNNHLLPRRGEEAGTSLMLLSDMWET